MTAFPALHAPIWISHRGLRQPATAAHQSMEAAGGVGEIERGKVLADNCREAFDRALAAGFTHFETDLRTGRDGQTVLAHDAQLQLDTGAVLTIETASTAALRAASRIWSA